MRRMILDMEAIPRILDNRKEIRTSGSFARQEAKEVWEEEEGNRVDEVLGREDN